LRDDAMAAAVAGEGVTIRIVDDQANVEPSRPPKRAKVRSKKVARATHRFMGYPVAFY
jgi:hypothetical protein